MAVLVQSRLLLISATNFRIFVVVQSLKLAIGHAELANVNFMVHTLVFRINVGSQIKVGAGQLKKINKHRVPLNVGGFLL